MINLNDENRRIINKLPLLSDSTMFLVESEEGLVEDFSNFFTSKMSQFSSYFTTNEKRITVLKSTYDIKTLNKFSKKIPKILSKVNYSRVSAIEVGSPIGMSVSLLDAVQLMEYPINKIRDKLLNIIDDCDTMIVRMITDREYRLSKRPFIIDKDILDDLKNYNGVLNKIIKPDNYSDRSTIGFALPNLSSLSYISKTLISVGDSFSPGRLNNVKGISDTINENIESLTQDIMTGGGVKIAKVRLISMANYVETVAKYITVSVSLLYVTRQLTEETNNILSILINKT